MCCTIRRPWYVLQYTSDKNKFVYNADSTRFFTCRIFSNIVKKRSGANLWEKKTTYTTAHTSLNGFFARNIALNNIFEETVPEF